MGMMRMMGMMGMMAGSGSCEPSCAAGAAHRRPRRSEERGGRFREREGLRRGARGPRSVSAAAEEEAGQSPPALVSLKLGEHHCCGGSLIQEDLVVTAAHCLVGLNEKQIKSLTVTAGQYSLSQKGEHEQKSPVSKIIIHPEYNRLGYMSSDIALLYLKHKVEFGTAVQPICLPHRDDKFEAGILCMTSGWCKISETSEYSNVLREVELPIMDDRMCNSVLKGMNFPLLGKTMMCASFPDEEKDACQ
ncbi:ovochymase-1-like, partial [Leptonychotes weddellii]|uniref:Ovochymase-1-like n=1 Tax=Leptonychotes weddellii TaxID=9713 RepID=A0A2U3Z7F4_LEPWE